MLRRGYRGNGGMGWTADGGCNSQLISRAQHSVGQPQLHGPVRVQKRVSVQQPVQLRRRDVRVGGFHVVQVQLGDLGPCFGHVLRVDGDVAGTPAEPPARLVHHDNTVPQHQTLPWLPPTQQQRPHGARLAQAHRADRTAHVLHGVVDRQPAGHAPPGAVDVHVDLGPGLGLQVQQLCRNNPRGLVVYGPVHADNPFFQQPGKDVVSSLSFRHNWNPNPSAGRLRKPPSHPHVRRFLHKPESLHHHLWSSSCPSMLKTTTVKGQVSSVKSQKSGVKSQDQDQDQDSRLKSREMSGCLFAFVLNI